MNKEEPYREQAERLKKRIEKINESIDVGDELPPRELLHREKKTKTKWKLKYPVIRILVLFFILLPVIILSAISYLDGKKGPTSEPAGGESVGYETINLEKTKSEEVNQEETVDTEESPAPEETPEAVETEESPADEPPDTTKPADGDNKASANQSTGEAPGDKNSQPSTPNSNNTTAKQQKTQKIISHKVQPQETLFSLAMKYYNSQNGMDTIKKANNLTSDEIFVGQVLKIPLN